MILDVRDLHHSFGDVNAINNISFSIDFIITIQDPLPIYMENLIGLMLKKIFYNLKIFIENINK